MALDQMSEPEKRTDVGRAPAAPETVHVESPYGQTPNAAPSSDDAGMPERIARFRVEKLLGRGGFGCVYLGFDEDLNRRVAIKVPHRRKLAKAGTAEAYLAEARTLASLDHPAIVPVFDVGRNVENCYFVSKFIEGSDLAIRMQQTRIQFAEAAWITAVIADALHHAHKQGVVHRDVKPANILLDANGNPFLSDFGLALEEQEFGKGQAWAGTPVYMSPEQARGDGNLVDGRSDIFSLGAVLYEMLTGHRPFQGDTLDAIIRQITTVNVKPPRQRDDTIPVELERICLKALEIDNRRRYTTARDMADDLSAFLAHAETWTASGSALLSFRQSGALPGRESGSSHLAPSASGSVTRQASTGTLPLLSSPRPQPTPRRFSVKTAGAFATVAVAIGLMAAFGVFSTSEPAAAPWVPQYTDRKPKIIGIYPSDAFGPARKAGLHAYVDEHPEVKVIDLDIATISQMKQGDIDPLLARLTEIIEEDNVLAVVGPPITECTKMVLGTVAATGKRVPVIVESAGAPGEIGWHEFESRIPIFRISSGIDRRAAEIALCIRDCVKLNQPVHLMIEEQQGGKRTYGEHLYEEIRINLRKWKVDPARLNALYFPGNDIESVMPRIRKFASESGVILMLGLGHHYHAIARELYQSTRPNEQPAARLVGWMNAYRMDREYREHDDYLNAALFEITDFDITDRGPKPPPFAVFEREFGEATPAVRDQAFSFDSGYCAIQSLAAVAEEHFPRKPGYYPLIDSHVRELFEQQLRTKLFQGVTGDIRFGAAGQNKDGRLDYVRFDKVSNRWVSVDYEEILGDGSHR